MLWIQPSRFGAAAPTYLVNQNFEGAGYDNGETWNPTGAGVDPDYTGVVLAGSQSLRVSDGSNAVALTYTTFAGQSDAWAYCKLRIVAFNASAGSDQFFFHDGTDTKAAMDIDSTGAVRLQANLTQSSASATTLSTGTTYHVWLRYVASGTCELAISTSTTRPTTDGSGNVYLTRTGAAGTASRIYCYNGFFALADFIFDDVRVATSEITP